MHVVITGGAGFIGSHLADTLLDAGNHVTAVDNLSLGRRENLAHLAGDPRFELRVFDAANTQTLRALLAEKRCQCVFHLAANSDIARSHDDPNVDFHNTLATTYSVLEAMRTTGVREIVFASTSAVYGDTNVELDEDFGPLLPVSHYGAAKLAGEAFISSFAANYGMRAWIARFPNVVGERATHGVIYDFIERLKQDPSRLRVLGDGRQAKPYLYVKDLVEALVYIWRNATAPVNLFNIGVTTRTNVERIAETIVEMMRITPRIEYTGGSRGWVGDVPQVRYRLDKLHALGWHARRDSDEAVRTAVRAILEGQP
jgi:UDP-glucose 4-epimerase